MLTNYQVIENRQMFLTTEVKQISKGQMTRAFKAHAKSTGDVRFFQNERGFLVVNADGWEKDGERLWIDFAQGTHPMDENDVSEFMGHLFPQTNREVVVIG